MYFHVMRETPTGRSIWLNGDERSWTDVFENAAAFTSYQLAHDIGKRESKEEPFRVLATDDPNDNGWIRTPLAAILHSVENMSLEDIRELQKDIVDIRFRKTPDKSEEVLIAAVRGVYESLGKVHAIRTCRELSKMPLDDCARFVEKHMEK